MASTYASKSLVLFNPQTRATHHNPLSPADATGRSLPSVVSASKCMPHKPLFMGLKGRLLFPGRTLC